MRTFRNYFVLVLSCIFFQYVHAQEIKGLWRKSPSYRVVQEKGKRPIQPKKYELYQVDFGLLKHQLNYISKRGQLEKQNKITIPAPEGDKTFVISITDILPRYLQAEDADIQTFFGYNILNPAEWVALDYTNHGFHAMISSPDGKDYFIDPYQMNDTENYIVYYRAENITPTAFECLINGEGSLSGFDTDGLVPEQSLNRTALETDCKLRTYRLAIACTGEYTAYHGGTQAQAQSGIATTISRVNQIFRRDLGVVLNIVSGASIIYDDAQSDPYINGDIYQMLDTNAYVIPDMIGDANFDIGHVFGTAGLLSGGLATRDGFCLTGDKSGGVTTYENPIGDQFDIDFVAHEIGHQIGARHTFNSLVGACAGWGQRSDLGAYEPGSGSTIMAYAGLCNQTGLSTDVQDQSEAFFHSYNIQEISQTLITGNGSQCGTMTNTGNSKPLADAGPVYYNLPINTPFELTGNSIDPDIGDVHTYSWEQYDLAPSAQNLPQSNSTDQPNFRVYEPTLSRTRHFPNIDSLAANVLWPKYEKIPSVARSMKFRLTVRDNSPSGCGCTDFDEVDLHFDDASGPFVVTSPNTTGIVWGASTSETVTWDVAGTNNAPVSCSSVDILLSTDGGITYPYILALNVPNDGSELITVPNIGTSTARVKVICSDNIFFDISNEDFTITSLPITDPEISFETTLIETFEENTPDGNVGCRAYKDYSVTMKITDQPTGNTTVNILSGGSATDGLDYQLLGAPIIFPVGSTSNRTFTIRILDDGEVDPLENVELTYTISGNTNAVAGTSNQICLIKIHDDEHAPYAGALPHFEEDFNTGQIFGPGNTNWSDANNSGNEVWMVGGNGEISASGRSLYVSDDGMSNSYNTSNSYNYVSVETPEINGIGKSNQILSFDFVSEGDVGHDFGRLSYDAGAGVTMIEGGNNAPFVGVSNKKNVAIALPTAVDGNNYKLTWGWINSVTNTSGVSGRAFEIDNIRVTEGTPGIRIETEITSLSDEQYLGPHQSIYFHDPEDGNLLLYIQNTSDHDYGCTTVEVDRSGKSATQFQSVNSVYDVTDKSYRVIPTNNSPSGTFNITLYYSEEEIAGWEAATGNNRNEIQVVKTIGPISTVTPANPQVSTTFYKPALLGSFGNDVTLTASYSNGFSGFAAGISEIPLPIELLSFEASAWEGQSVVLDWSTATERNNDYFTIERSLNGLDWEFVAKVGGAGNSATILNYKTYDFTPHNGLSYYRLKQTDFDGQFTYSDIRSVMFDAKEGQVKVYPNYVYDSFTLEGSESELSTIELYTSSGQQVTSLAKIEKKTNERYKLDIRRLAAGIYYVKTKSTVHKICKQ